MSRSFIYLRRALFGVSCAIVFGFGATQAFATPDQGARRALYCLRHATNPQPYFTPFCDDACNGGPGRGYCDAEGVCRCV